jgi:hypothetical protein
VPNAIDILLHYANGGSKEMAAFFCSACCAKIFSSCHLARWTAPIGMPVSTEIARILRPAATSNFGASAILGIACFGRCESCGVGVHFLFYRRQRAVRNAEFD